MTRQSAWDDSGRFLMWDDGGLSQWDDLYDWRCVVCDMPGFAGSGDHYKCRDCGADLCGTHDGYHDCT